MADPNRPRGIGSSEAADICGCGFGTALHVYLRNVGEEVEREVSLPMELGTYLEDFIAKRYEQRTGWELHGAMAHRPHPDYPFLFSSVDRWVHKPDGPAIQPHKHLCELKWTATCEGWGEEWTDEVPMKYLLQVNHQMLTTGAEVADIAALSPWDFRIYRVPRRETLIQSLLEVELAFWRDFVEKRVPPPVDWNHPEAAKLFDFVHRPDPLQTVELDHVADVVAAAYETTSAKIKELEKDKADARAFLAEQMGAAAFGKLPSGKLVRRTRVGDSVRLTVSQPRTKRS